MDLGGILLALLGVAVVALVGLWHFYQGAAVQREAIERFRRDQGERTTRRVRGQLGDALRRTDVGRDLEDRLSAAGMTIAPVDAIAAVIAIWAGATLLGLAILPTPLAIAAGLGAVAGCEGYRRYRLSKRTEAFVAQLPELARSMANGAAAGLALTSAVEMTATDIDDPARTVLRQVLDELRIGQSVEGAFANLERRMPSREVGVLVSTLVIQQRAGGDVVHALRGMAQTLDDRKETAREVRTTLAEAKQTGYLVVAMGMAVPVLMNMVVPGALDAVVGSWIGRFVLLVSGGLFLTGFLMIRQMTKAI